MNYALAFHPTTPFPYRGLENVGATTSSSKISNPCDRMVQAVKVDFTAKPVPCRKVEVSICEAQNKHYFTRTAGCEMALRGDPHAKTHKQGEWKDVKPTSGKDNRTWETSTRSSNHGRWDEKPSTTKSPSKTTHKSTTPRYYLPGVQPNLPSKNDGRPRYGR